MAFIKFTGEEKVYYKYTDPLTPEEDARQAEASAFWHDLLIEATHDLTDHVPDEEIGVMLSGGADSTALLCALVEMGRKPKAFTMKIGTNPFVENDEQTIDIRNSHKIADYLGVEIHDVVIDDDPEETARAMHEYALLEPFNLDSQPDFCVGHLYRKMADYASKLGVTVMVNGLDPIGPIPNSSVELFEKRGSRGLISRNEMNAIIVSGLSNFDIGNQPMGFSNITRTYSGVDSVSPFVLASMMVPFKDLSFREMHRKRKKWVISRPWAEMLEGAKLAPNIRPMQTGDSGGTEMFKRVIPSSKYAARMLGLDETLPLNRTVNPKERIPAEVPSLGRYVSFLRKAQASSIEKQERIESDSATPNGKHIGAWPVFWAIGNGTPIAPYLRTSDPMNPDGSLILDTDSAEAEEDNLFAADVMESVNLIEDYNSAGETVMLDSKDPRTGPFGGRLAHGYELCDPRSRAGLYTVALTPNVEDRQFDVNSSSTWALGIQSLWSSLIPYVDSEPDYMSDALFKWLQKAIDHYNVHSTLIEETERLSDRISEIESGIASETKAYDLPWVITDYAARVGKRDSW